MPNFIFYFVGAFLVIWVGAILVKIVGYIREKNIEVKSEIS